MDRPTWAPVEVDVERPSAARVYDYWLGGSHNFAVDRALAEQALRIVPELPEITRANRAFLRRAVRYCLDDGIRQFLDLGSGIPTVGNVHEVAQAVDPAARVVYVDNDPVAVAHSRAILAGNEHAAVVQADACDPDAVLAAPETRRLIDPDQPVAVLMMALLHFVPDSGDPAGIIARYRNAGPSGSYLLLSHGTDAADERRASMKQLYARSATPLALRSPAAVAALLAGYELVPPGVVYLPEWRPEPADAPDPDPSRFGVLAGVGRTP
ncbi:SAM-dependent methyltransferase [Streptoalloteichus hindustanus]|uniref:S-adenosyl methyltransferase n=1 Tax=Streptoalloteichus hindustanus TaxID=2017 RepID=A0A1M4UA87_STRHI|nr:SAM-dependent methyltransferase [Streptoalloteichus hindustanus]SHE53702.1 S-adenosyl methyltransferase [Streptoalloteichus hindustanus]